MNRALRSKAARNEERKLQTTTLNTVGLAVFGLGALTPVFAGSSDVNDVGSIALSCLVFYMLHQLARAKLRGLED